MQQQQSSKKTFLVLIVVILLALGAYFYFKGEPSDSSSSLEVQDSPETADALARSARVLSLLNQINSLKIDASIFESAVYNTLVDYTIEIPEQNVGRPNPFAPIAGSAPQNPSIRLPSGN